jgi:hypothetical protein
MLFFFSAKVAVQIVDYYNLAANTLDLISSDECSVSEILGAKIYKVCANVNTGEIISHAVRCHIHPNNQSCS